MLAGVVAAHLGAAGGGEQAAGGVDGLEIVLGLDQGVVAAQAVDLGADVGRDVLRDPAWHPSHGIELSIPEPYSRW